MIAITGDGAADDPRRIRLEPDVAESPLFQCADLEVLDEHVGLLYELREDVLAGLLYTSDAADALVAVDAKVVGRFLFRKGGPPASRVISRSAWLHLDSHNR